MDGPQPPPNWLPYITQLGLITYTWAVIETSMDMAASITFHALGGKDLKRKLPRHPEQTEAFLRRCYQELQSLGDIKDKGIALLDRISAMKDDRHFYVHALAGEELKKVIRDPKMYGTETRKLDMAAMFKFVAAITQLSQDTAYHVQDDLLPLAKP